MSWQDARAVAEALFEKLDLPADLSGLTLQVVDFDTEADCRSYYPDRPLGFHRMVLTAAKKIAWKRGTHSITATYLRAARFDLPQSDRTELADRCFKALPQKSDVQKGTVKAQSRPA